MERSDLLVHLSEIIFERFFFSPLGNRVLRGICVVLCPMCPLVSVIHLSMSLVMSKYII